MTLSSHPTDDEILDTVETWIDDLARKDFKAAFARTDHDKYFGWSPALIEAVVQGYGLPGTTKQGRKCEVSSRSSSAGVPHRRVVNRNELPLNSIASVEYSLPLDGMWSDLTATFRLEAREHGSVLVLEEIHVF